MIANSIMLHSLKSFSISSNLIYKAIVRAFMEYLSTVWDPYIAMLTNTVSTI